MRSSVGTLSALDRKAGRLYGGLRTASRLVLAATLVAPLLAGCGNGGFRPLYGGSAIGGAHADERLARVSVATIPGRVGQQIRNELIFHATGGGGEVVQPDLRLEVAIRESVTSTLVRVDGESGSQVYSVEAKFRLVRVSDNSVVLTGTSYGRAAFERNTSIFSNVRAREDAENRASKVVGEDLKARLSAHLASAA
ncbi:LPS assembly lipoprotein LptE [Hyphomicrobium sp. CS1GBMeth3]|uniref:LPS assembly lipoprotein LptE n=1 Tax=Hyphomicrobium sp. CS1GBMeth3 TaxID=1892845 RepID=UPI0009318F66|nr:LPS assembly lipoprotein LptE [Hyphomicrobium sp. CS1GBMeth3]